MKKIITLLLLAVVVVSTAEAAYKVKKIKSPEGTTITGVVYCDNQPLVGVQVSDGVQIVTTDEKGIYNITSTKPWGMVFITTPSGYAPLMFDDVRPTFWKQTKADPHKKERIDFRLQKVDDSKFSVLIMSDTHLCNDKKRSDLKHFRKLAMPAIHRAAKEAGENLISINLGDITWDRFWYANNFSIEHVPQFLIENKFRMPLYCVHGNHDYDPAVPPTENPNVKAIQRFCATFGPTYYSMNKGNVHFVFLDNILYKNEITDNQKKAPNVIGSRNYDMYIDNTQMEWLSQDLSYVDKSTPIVICMHAPLYTYNGKGERVYNLREDQAETLIEMVKDFKSVRFFTGHSHRNMSFTHPELHNIVEYNLTSISGDLWKTPNEYGISIGEDGADAGFYLCTFEGDKFTKYWYSVEGGSLYPFRVYDMNEVAKAYVKDRAVLWLCNVQSEQVNYANSAYNNYIYVNCWTWEEGCSLAATENGDFLKVEKVSDSDPLAAKIVFAPSYIDPKTAKASSKVNRLSLAANMFRIKASDSTTPIVLTYTTPYGGSYTQTIQRPVSFPVK